MRFYKHFVVITLFLLAFANTAFAQFDIPPLPSEAQQSSVYDYAQLLSAQQKKSLETKLLNYADSTSTQIVIAIVPTINGENIGVLTPKWAHEWGIGQANEDNGVFILLAEEERKIYLSAGYGLEHILTAGRGGEITRNNIIPYFKKGDYYGGLDAGTDALIDLFAGAYQNDGTDKQSSNDFGWGKFLFIFAIVIIFLIIASKSDKGGKGGGYRGGGFGGPIILSGGGRSSWGGGGSFGGGGFGGGFGGGGFSGGGSGGSW